jgi:hypothetical protein
MRGRGIGRKEQGLAAFLLCLVVIASSLTAPVGGNPGEDSGTTHHSKGNYRITATPNGSIEVVPGSNFTITVEATGVAPIVQFHPDSDDNRHFNCSPTNYVPDNSPYDRNRTTDSVLVVFRLTAPEQMGNFTILLFARSPGLGEPDLDYVQLTVIVGLARLRAETVWKAIYNHLNIYLGTLALTSGYAAAIIYERNKRRTKSHGILATTALLATGLNIWEVLPTSLLVIQRVMGGLGDATDNYTVFHIALGAFGFAAGVLAWLTGMAGIRTKKPGYVALASWTVCYVTGLLVWGVNW